jgi:cation transport ATPase
VLRHGEKQHVFKVRQRIRPGAAEVMSALRDMGLTVEILSGDRERLSGSPLRRSAIITGPAE